MCVYECEWDSPLCAIALWWSGGRVDGIFRLCGSFLVQPGGGWRWKWPPIAFLTDWTQQHLCKPPCYCLHKNSRVMWETGKHIKMFCRKVFDFYCKVSSFLLSDPIPLTLRKFCDPRLSTTLKTWRNWLVPWTKWLMATHTHIDTHTNTEW